MRSRKPETREFVHQVKLIKLGRTSKWCSYTICTYNSKIQSLIVQPTEKTARRRKPFVWQNDLEKIFKNDDLELAGMDLKS